MSERYLTVAEFVQELKDRYGISVTVHTVRRWIKTGFIQGKRVGPKKYHIPASELERVGG